MADEQIDPNDYSVVLSLSRAFAKAAYDSLGLSITDFRVLANIVACDGKRSGEVASSLGLSRSAVSMSIRKLWDSRLATHRRDGDAAIIATPGGRKAFAIGREAMYRALVEDAPALRQGEKEALNYYMAMIADRLGTPLTPSLGIDTTILYLEANARTKQLLKRSCNPQGLTPNGFVAMSALESSGGSARPKDLAQSARMSRPLMTKCCSALASCGYVEVSGDAGDGRGKTVTATDLGSAAFRAAFDAFWSEFSARTRAFSTEEMRFFRAIYRRR